MESKKTLQIPLNGSCKGKTYYGLNENGNRQIKFEPPAYQQRYSAVLSILSNDKWKKQMKKVSIEMNV